VFKRIVNVIEVLVLAAALVFVVALFTNDGGGDAPATTGAALFTSHCARCHGSEGGGGIGPQLSDGKVVAAFPDIADEITIVTRGNDGMPAFGGVLSAEEIEQVVDYTRTL
jgi:mono/diheme cytochrome c family protein